MFRNFRTKKIIPQQQFSAVNNTAIIYLYNMNSSRLAKSISLQDVIISTFLSKAQTQLPKMPLFVHILDCIGALSCIRSNQIKKNEQTNALTSSKHRVFWQAVREIVDRETALEHSDEKEKKTSPSSAAKNMALELVLEKFPRKNGRT